MFRVTPRLALDFVREHPPEVPTVIVAHADWGVDPRKRWVAVAAGNVADGWSATAARVMPDGRDLRLQLAVPLGEQLVAGFDFPIGLPRAYAERAGVRRFLEVLPRLGHGEWADFFGVADLPAEVSINRPFYPRTARVKGAKRQVDLTTALGIAMSELRRRCELAQPNRSAACPLFWTVGGNQVGKGALAGWEMLRAHPPDALSFWPFDGAFDELLESRQTVVAETYPAEFYGHLGLPRVVSKRRHASRTTHAARLRAAADELGIRLSPGLRAQVDDGFGATAHGEDAFDAFVGLVGMINVISGRRQSGEPSDDEHVKTVEGWILGQSAIEVDGRSTLAASTMMGTQSRD